MKQFLKKTWEKVTGTANPLEIEWQIYVRLQGISVWTLCGRRPEGKFLADTHIEGSTLRVLATENDIAQFMRGGSCLRGLPSDMTQALRAGQKVETTLKDLIPYLRQGAKD
jgi:hypothetical protein